MAVNRELISRVLAHIEANPQEWDQRGWFWRSNRSNRSCGTKACFAGRALLLSGYQIVSTGSQFDLDTMIDPYGHVVRDYDAQAAKVLGLPVDLAKRIFDSSVYDFQSLENVVMKTVEKVEQASRVSA